MPKKAGKPRIREKIEKQERYLQSYNLVRIEGIGYRAAGRKLGVSHATVMSDVQRRLVEIQTEQKKEIEAGRIKMNAKLESLELLVMDSLLTGRGKKVDKDLVNSLIKIYDQQAKLNGLNAPVKVEMPSDPVTEVLKEISKKGLRGRAALTLYLDTMQEG